MRDDREWTVAEQVNDGTAAMEYFDDRSYAETSWLHQHVNGLPVTLSQLWDTIWTEVRCARLDVRVACYADNGDGRVAWVDCPEGELDSDPYVAEIHPSRMRGHATAALRMAYRDYLRSDAWRKTRLTALRRFGYRCHRCCSARNLDVHHLTYDRIGSEAADDLVALCRRCHQAVETRAT